MTQQVEPSASEQGNPANSEDARRDWEQWRLERAAELATPHGWCSLTGLHWAGPDPAPLGDLPGTWWADDAGLWLRSDASGPAVRGGSEADDDGARLVLATGGTGGARVTDGERLLELLDRGPGLLGVRVRDPRAVPRPAVVPAFDYTADWVLAGRFEAFAEPVATSVGSVVDGVTHELTIVGEVIVDRAGEEIRLVVGEDGSFAFRDATSGRETYGALRFARAEIDGDRATIDFNRATNPPCAFTDFGTCPLPPEQNVLRLRVTAGERVPE